MKLDTLVVTRVALIAFLASNDDHGRAFALSHTVSFPLTTGYNSKSGKKLTSAFVDMVDSTAFIERSTSISPATETTDSDFEQEDIFTVPAFGDNCVVTFQKQEAAIREDGLQEIPKAPEYVLQVDGASKDDFGWICLKFYETRKSFAGLDMKNLRSVVASHMQKQPPHPGFDASLADLAGSDVIEELFGLTSSKRQSVLDELSTTGFVVLDAGPKVSRTSNEKLSDFLLHKTGQDTAIRSDTVAYLARDDAKSCGLGHEFDLLMGIASYLNQEYDFESFDLPPVFPGTATKPLTNPKNIQAAEYGKGNYYVAHSDNSWAKGKHMSLRSNFRSFTAILYCNDDWEEEDGGALRIYKDSTHLARAKEAHQSCEFTDIVPKNGRLVIFNSKLVHSVEKVLVDKKRRALTIWIARPSEGGIEGEEIEVPL